MSPRPAARTSGVPAFGDALIFHPSELALREALRSLLEVVACDPGHGAFSNAMFKVRVEQAEAAYGLGPSSAFCAPVDLSATQWLAIVQETAGQDWGDARHFLQRVKSVGRAARRAVACADNSACPLASFRSRIGSSTSSIMRWLMVRFAPNPAVQSDSILRRDLHQLLQIAANYAKPNVDPCTLQRICAEATAALNMPRVTTPDWRGDLRESQWLAIADEHTRRDWSDADAFLEFIKSIGRLARQMPAFADYPVDVPQ